MKNVAIDERQTLCLITKELNGKALFQYFRKDLGIPAETTYAESDFCNYINAKIDCLLGCATDTGRLGKQIHQSLLGYSTATTTRTIAETLRIINTDIKYYVTQQFPQVQQSVEFDSKEYENKSNNPVTAQAKFTTKLLGKYGSLFGNFTPAAGQTEENSSTWEQPLAQNLTESASPLIEETAILQPIGLSDKGKQPALAPGEHLNTNISPINWIMAYWDITKLEKFSGEEDNAYSWITNAEKNNDCTIQALPFFLTRTANSWYQSLAKKPTFFTEFKLAFLQYFYDPNIDYYTTAQVFNQFIKGLRSSILRSIRPRHPTSLQDAIALAHDFESPELQELTNHPNGEKITTTADTHSNRTVNNSNNLEDLISTTKIMNQNQGNPYQQPRYQQNMVPQYSIPQNQPPLYAQQVPYTQPPPQNYYQPPPMTQAIPHY
ncbi:hypothetical protein G9A89_009663 [Geosiphon pyriformis]|nr:hypothetical protein G9A89_009663 [Geosiphon pyriformis]